MVENKVLALLAPHDAGVQFAVVVRLLARTLAGASSKRTHRAMMQEVVQRFKELVPLFRYEGVTL
jgi:hypothetical protein